MFSLVALTGEMADTKVVLHREKKKKKGLTDAANDVAEND